MKTKVLILVVLVASIAMFATGAFAYFTTEASASGNIKSGTLGLKIASVIPSASCPAANEITQTTASLWENTNLAPGDVFNGKLCMKNDGTIDMEQVVFNWTGLSGALADNLFVTSLYNSRTGEEIGAYITAFGGADGKMSLTELGSHAEDEYWVGGVDVFLPAGDVQWVKYTFEFNPEAGNLLQGLNFDYSLAITGYQHAKY